MTAPPLAPRRAHAVRYHDREFHDDFAWMRQKDDPAVMHYIEAENRYTAEAAAPLRPLEDELYAEMLGRIQQTDLTVPVRRGGFFYYTRTEEGLQYPIHCRRGLEEGAPEQVLLDCNQLAAGHPFFDLGAFEVSDDGRLLACTSDTVGFRQYKLWIKDLGTGALLDDTAERVTTAAWAADGRTLLYTTEDEVTKRSDRLWRLELGHEAVEVLFEPDELYNLGVARTRDRAFFVLHIAATDSTEVRLLPLDRPAGEWLCPIPRRRDHKYYVDHRAGRLYILTNLGAKNFRLVTTPSNAPDFERAAEFVPHRPEVLLQDIELFQHHAVLVEKTDALNHLRVHDFRTGAWSSIAVPEPVYALHPAGNPEFAVAAFRYHYQSMVTPPSVFEYDFESGASRLLKQQVVVGGHDPARYETRRLWVPAGDGAKIPVSLVRLRAAPRDGGAPLLLYGYGAYGLGMPAGFSVARLSLLDRGVGYAIAHVRGGNELGEPWHDGGMLMKKKNTFDDFIAVAEHLVAQGWTAPARLAIEGGSAGGLLIGAVLNKRPDLFAAAHLAVPFVDVINTMMDATLPLTVGEYLEWGDPRQPPAFDYMASYSPYDNIAERPYPNVLVTTSLNDSQVMYWEPVKYVARLRGLARPPAQLLLKVNLGAGHGGASGRYDRLREVAFEYAWILRQIAPAAA